MLIIRDRRQSDMSWAQTDIVVSQRQGCGAWTRRGDTYHTSPLFGLLLFSFLAINRETDRILFFLFLHLLDVAEKLNVRLVR